MQKLISSAKNSNFARKKHKNTNKFKNKSNKRQTNKQTQNETQQKKTKFIEMEREKIVV